MNVGAVVVEESTQVVIFVSFLPWAILQPIPQLLEILSFAQEKSPVMCFRLVQLVIENLLPRYRDARCMFQNAKPFRMPLNQFFVDMTAQIVYLGPDGPLDRIGRNDPPVKVTEAGYQRRTGPLAYHRFDLWVRLQDRIVVLTTEPVKFSIIVGWYVGMNIHGLQTASAS